MPAAASDGCCSTLSTAQLAGCPTQVQPRQADVLFNLSSAGPGGASNRRPHRRPGDKNHFASGRCSKQSLLGQDLSLRAQTFTSLGLQARPARPSSSVGERVTSRQRPLRCSMTRCCVPPSSVRVPARHTCTPVSFHKWPQGRPCTSDGPPMSHQRWGCSPASLLLLASRRTTLPRPWGRAAAAEQGHSPHDSCHPQPLSPDLQ